MSDPGAPLQAEQAVLGSMLIDRDCIHDILARLRDADFALKINRRIFRAIQTLELAGKLPDAQVVAGELRADEALRRYLADLMDLTPTSANALEYAGQVLDASRRRALRQAAQNALTQLDAGEPAEQVLDALSQAVTGTAERMGGELLTPMQQVERFYAYRARIDDGETPLVRTGYRLIDRLLGGGMVNSGLYFLAARPGMGKTTLALNIAENAAKISGEVLFISLEMDNEQLIAKRVSAMDKLPYQVLLNEKLSEKEYDKLAQAAKRVSESRIYTNAGVGADVKKICAMAQSRKGIRLVIIDHFSLIQVPGKRSRYEEYTAVSAALKRLARAMKAPVLCLAQLNRMSEQRTNKRPLLSDLRDTGAAEQDADGILLLHRPAYYGEAVDKDDVSYVELTVAKNRHGQTGLIPMNFYLKTNIFLEKYCN